MEFFDQQAKVTYLAENLQVEILFRALARITGKTRDEIDDLWSEARREALDELDTALHELWGVQEPRKEIAQ